MHYNTVSSYTNLTLFTEYFAGTGSILDRDHSMTTNPMRFSLLAIYMLCTKLLVEICFLIFLLLSILSDDWPVSMRLLACTLVPLATYNGYTSLLDTMKNATYRQFPFFSPIKLTPSIIY